MLARNVRHQSLMGADAFGGPTSETDPKGIRCPVEIDSCVFTNVNVDQLVSGRNTIAGSFCCCGCLTALETSMEDAGNIANEPEARLPAVPFSADCYRARERHLPYH